MAKDNKSNKKSKLVSRRDFLVAGGAVIAAGALSACTHKNIIETITTKTGTTSAATTSTVTGTINSTNQAITTRTMIITAITGSVELPSGLSTAGHKVVNSLGEAAVSSNGQFKINAIEGARQLTVVMSNAGNPMLLAWPDEKHKVINAHTTAEVLVYMATGLFMLPADAQNNAMDLLANSIELANLEKAIVVALAQDTETFSKPNQQVDQALSNLVDQLAVPNKVKTARNNILGGRHGLVS
jgi:hypothetical protein